MKWAFDLASMLQVGLVAFMTAGAFLPMTYFDLTYQLMALSAILVGQCVQEVPGRQSVKLRIPAVSNRLTDKSLNTL